MIEPQADAIYLVELCSGERRRWRCLVTGAGEAVRRWRDLESGREFTERELMYAWQLVARLEADCSEPRRSA